MAQSLIKMRPKGKFNLTADQMNCLTWYALSGCSKADAFATFVAPNLAEQKTLLSSASKQFFGSVDAVAYLRAYRAELNLADEATTEAKKPKERDLESKKAEASKAIAEWAYENAANIDNLDEDAVTLLLKALDKLGLFDETTVAVEKPRRYLPVLCQSSCLYRLFCEQNIANGNILNECDYCRAKAFAVDRGFCYDASKLLDIPKDVLKDKELENYTIENAE
jgi:hypothetical protein